MRLKKWLVGSIALFATTFGFAYPAPDDEDPMTRIFQQYQEETARLNRQYDEKLFTPIKNLITLAMQIQQSQTQQPTPEQETQINTTMNQLDSALDAMVTSALTDVDINQVNTQYKQAMASMGVQDPEELTLETLKDLLKGMYLMGALIHFEQTHKLTDAELEVAAFIFFPQVEETTEEAPATQEAQP